MLTHGDQMLRDTARAAFWGTFYDTPDLMATLATTRTSGSDQETYAGFAFAPGVREFTGARMKRSVPQLTYTLVNKEWESTVAIDYKTRKFNRNGDVANLLANMGKKARTYPTKLGSTVLNDNPLGYDGIALFSAAHKDPGVPYQTSQSNLLTTGSYAWATDGVPTDAEWSTAVRDSMQKLRTFKDGDGDPFWPGGEFDCIVMVPPQLYEISARIQTVETLSGTISNDLKGRYRTVANPYLPYVAANCRFYVINASTAEKPLIYQVAEDVGLSDDMGGDNDFDTKSVNFGTYALYNVGVGNWRTCVQVEAT